MSWYAGFWKVWNRSALDAGYTRLVLDTTLRHDVAGSMSELRAEMVANVWKILVAEGDEVENGQPLVILESMKMEIPVMAERAGTVTQLSVTEGSVVQEGELIAVVG